VAIYATLKTGVTLSTAGQLIRF